jgi:hypothetical protein
MKIFLRSDSHEIYQQTFCVIMLEVFWEEVIVEKKQENIEENKKVT